MKIYTHFSWALGPITNEEINDGQQEQTRDDPGAKEEAKETSGSGQEEAEQAA